MSFNDSRSIHQIVEHLNQDDSLRLTTEYWPHKPSEYNLLDPLGVYLCGYAHSDFGQPSCGFKERVMIYSFSMITRSLIDSAEYLDDLEAFINSLEGWKHESWRRPLSIKRDGFAREEDGVWQHDFLFHLPTLTATNADI